MSKTFTPSPATPAVLTANDLRSGRSVWRDASGWNADPRTATLFTDAAAAEAALTTAMAEFGRVIGPYLAEAREADGIAAPVHFREAFRQSGPSTEPAALHFREAAHA